MADIARLAGVSESTVSRAIAGSPLVNDETRERVTKIAAEARYTVNEAARNLRRKESRTVDVVIPITEYNRKQMSDPFFLDMIGALADVLTERGYDLLLSKTAPWTPGARRNPLQSGRADGMIVIGQDVERDRLRAFIAEHGRTVVWGTQTDGDAYVAVGSDNERGGWLAARHLLSSGRRRLAFFGPDTQPEVAERLAGFRRAHAEAGVAVDERLVRPVPFDAHEAREAVLAFCEGGASFDGICAASDLIAMTAMGVLGLKGLDVPGDVGVVGYDDIFPAASANPPLTTVTQSVPRGAEEMVDALLGLLAGEERRGVMVPTELVVRQSCGAQA